MRYLFDHLFFPSLLNYFCYSLWLLSVFSITVLCVYFCCTAGGWYYTNQSARSPGDDAYPLPDLQYLRQSVQFVTVHLTRINDWLDLSFEFHLWTARTFQRFECAVNFDSMTNLPVLTRSQRRKAKDIFHSRWTSIMDHILLVHLQYVQQVDLSSSLSAFLL